MTNSIKTLHRILDDEASFVRLDAVHPDPLRGINMDQMVVMGARVSYDKGLKNNEADRKLVKYLMDNKHMSPFEQPQATFTVRLPKMAIIQLLRHRAFHFNSESGRYSEVKDELYIPKNWRMQSTKNKQMSGENASPELSELMTSELNAIYSRSKTAYQNALDAGVAKELARLFLPGDGMYVTLMFTGDLRNLLHFMELRCDEHAQWEIRQAACAIYTLLAPYCPWTLNAWIQTITKSALDNVTDFAINYFRGVYDEHV